MSVVAGTATLASGLAVRFVYTSSGSSRSWNCRLDAGQRGLQRRFLGMIQRGLQHRSAFALETFEHLVGGDLPQKDEQRRRSGLDDGRRLFHEFVVDAEIGQSTADSTAGGAQGSTRKRHQEYQADQRTPECTTDSASRSRVDHLI